MKKSIILASLILSAGCAHFSTIQTDERTNPNTGEKTTIITKATASTFAASKSALANWKASQTEKTQGATVGSLTQESDASAIVKAAVEAAIAAGKKL